MILTQASLTIGIFVGIMNLFVMFLGGIKIYVHIVKKLDRIEYALFNDGNGAIQKINDLYKNQALIKTDIEVVKARIEN
jgi:hypothetical protein